MKIAIFSDTFFPQVNGVANVAYQSAVDLAGLGHEVIVFTVASPANKKKIEGISGFRVVFLPSLPALAYPGERAGFPLGATALSEVVKFKPDIIHTHTPLPVGWAAVAAAKMLGAKLVGTHHTFYDHYLKHMKLDYQWGRKFSWQYTVGYYNRCDLVLSPSASLAEELKTHGLTKPVEILLNPIDTELFSPPTAGEKKILKKEFGITGKSLVYMGRLSYEKSIDQIVEAFASAVKKNPELTLMLVGDGPEREKLAALAAKLGVADKLIFTGVRRGKGLAESMCANDVFITASKSENMPLSVLEAMAAGLPVISVKEKGLQEMVDEGASGVFMPTDNPTGMAEVILRVLSDGELINRMSRGARESAEKYSRPGIAKLLVRAYEKLLNPAL